MESSSKRGRRYDADFKENAVALVKSGRTIVEVARDLGVTTWSLRHWVVRKSKGEDFHQPKTLAAETPEQREIRRLRQDIDYLRRQRDILKKALAIVSDGNLPGASNS
jgi:transposase